MEPREAIMIAAAAVRDAQAALDALIDSQTRMREAALGLESITDTPPRHLELATTLLQGADAKAERLRGQITRAQDQLSDYMVNIEAIRAQLE